MRWPFACALRELARRDPRVVLLIGDVGASMFADFAREYPSRFYNLGIAEQSLVGIAAGMALGGLRPVVYTIAPFLLERAFEQIKLDVDAMSARVLLVGYQDMTGGITHRALNPEAMLAAIPTLRAVLPWTLSDLESYMQSTVPDEWPAFLLLRSLT